MKIVKGNLIELAKNGEFDVIMHGCNCFCTMGAGIAAQIAKEFPLAYVADNRTEKGDVMKLGNWSSIVAVDRLGIINAYTQFYPGADFKLWALESVLTKLVLSNHIHRLIDKELEYSPKIGIPWIGCGIGGGSKGAVKSLLKRFSGALNLTVVEL